MRKNEGRDRNRLDSHTLACPLLLRRTLRAAKSLWTNFCDAMYFIPAHTPLNKVNTTELSEGDYKYYIERGQNKEERGREGGRRRKLGREEGGRLGKMESGEEGGRGEGGMEGVGRDRQRPTWRS